MTNTEDASHDRRFREGDYDPNAHVRLPQSLDFGKVGPGFGGDQDVAHPPRKEVWVDADIG